MMELVLDTFTICKRELIKYFRQKTRIIVTMVQPVIWLALMGNTMSKITNNPFASKLFGTGNYLSFMTPGIIIMTSLFSGIFAGTSIIWDRRIGYLDKLLAAPIKRASIPFGKTLSASIQGALQSAIIMLFAYILGVRFASGFLGVLVIILISMFFSFIFSGISLILSSTIKTIETLMAIINFMTLPLMFSSTALFPSKAMPDWLSAIAKINPLSYAVDPIRTLTIKGWEFSSILPGVIIILIFDLIIGFLSYYVFKRLTSD